MHSGLSSRNISILHDNKLQQKLHSYYNNLEHTHTHIPTILGNSLDYFLSFLLHTAVLESSLCQGVSRSPSWNQNKFYINTLNITMVHDTPLLCHIWKSSKTCTDADLFWPISFPPCYYYGICPHKLQLNNLLNQCFSTFVRPRPGKLFFYKKRARSQQIYS